MRINIRDDHSYGQRRDSQNLTAIRKSEKAKDPRVSDAKKIAISEVVANSFTTANQALSLAPSPSSENLFSHFTNPQKAFTPLAAFKSVAYKDPALLLSNISKPDSQSFVFGQQTLVPGSLEDDYIFSRTIDTFDKSLNNKKSSTVVRPSVLDAVVPKTSSTTIGTSVQDSSDPDIMILPETTIYVDPVEESVTLKKLINHQHTSIAVGTSVQNSLDPDIMISPETTMYVDPVEESVNLKKVVNHQQTSTAAGSSVQNSLVPYTMNLPQIVVDVEPTTDNSKTVKGLLNNQPTSIPIVSTPPLPTESLSVQNSLVPYKVILPQTVVCPQPVDDKAPNNFSNNKPTTGSLSNTACTVSPSIKNSLVPYTMNARQTGLQPTKESNSFLNDLKNLKNLIYNQQSSTNRAKKINSSNTASTTVSSSIQNSLVPCTMNVQQSESQPIKESNAVINDLVKSRNLINNQQSSTNSTNSKQSKEENTVSEKQVSKKLAQPRKDVNSKNSSNIQKAPPVEKNPKNTINNLLKIQKQTTKPQSSAIITHTKASNTSSSTINDNSKMLHSQNLPTKGMKRKADEMENVIKYPGNSGSKKKNKKKGNKKFQFIKQFNQVNKSKQNAPIVENYNALMCAIVEEQYPNMPPLTNVHLEIIRNVIKKKIDDLPTGIFVPKFMYSFIKNGVILVECADSNSKEWLKHSITNYSPEEGILLKVIPPEAVNRYYPASIFVCDEKNAIEVLKRMQKQNPDISINNWQYVSTVTVKECTPGITINVEIPATSVAQLKEKNFTLFHAVGQVTVVLRVKVPF